MRDAGDDEREDGHVLHRLVFFSDAVFAIVLTLLVLELRPPAIHAEADLLPALRGMSRHFIAFASSFALISIFWAAHMSIMRRIVVFDWLVAWLNLLFLFTIALMPFVSALIGEHGVVGAAWQAYSVVLIAASVAQCALLLALIRDRGRLVGGVSPRAVRYRLLRAASPGIVFSVGLTLSLSGRPGLAALCWVLFPPILWLARLLFGPIKAKADEAGATDAAGA